MLKFIDTKMSDSCGEDPESLLREEERRIIVQIKAVENKIKKSWENFSFAKAEYTEIAVLELKLAETEHCLLNRKLKMLRGDPLEELRIHIKFPWLQHYADKGL